MPEHPNAGFQRARTDEQREIRRHTILETALAMLEEMPVADVTLNELSRRVGLAKSNVLRYFETREAVLLELLVRATDEWLTDLDEQLASRRNPEWAVQQRATELATVVSRSLTNRPILCDLIHSQAAELQRNVSVEVALQFEHSGRQQLKGVADLFRSYLPELGDLAGSVAILGMVLAGALTAASRLSPRMLEANEVYRSGRPRELQLPDGLENALALLIAGGLARQHG